MPPRASKKAAASSDDAPAPATRSSSRIKAANNAPAPPAQPAVQAPKPKSRAKRARAASDDEDEGSAKDDAPAKKKIKAPASKAKPPSSKAKVSASKTKAPASKAKAPASKSKAPAAVPDAVDDEEDDAEEEPPAKMVTVVKRGAAPVDPSSGRLDTHQVYADTDGVWDAMLNQTDIGDNKNKFYVIQLLHPVNDSNSCELFTRWGRVGENGQKQTKGPWAPHQAIAEFKKQFKSKTSTNWGDRVGMVTKKGKYTWLERSFEDEDDAEDTIKDKSDKEPEKTPDSTLAAELQEFCRLIFSTAIIDAHLSSMNYDARKLPLGKLAKSTVLNGFSALKEISELLQKETDGEAISRAELVELSNRYYSIIPHDFGRIRATALTSMELLKRELDLVDALGDMEIATKLIQSTVHTDANGNPVNPIDAQFLSLGLATMDPIMRGGSEFSVLEDYVKHTHGSTHGHIRASIINAFRVERTAETDAWHAAGYGTEVKNGERLLLWHGSRTTNFAGILKQGLRIAPPQAPVTGYMFGKGVYFADMMSKSAGYCHPHLSGNVGVMLLCEVAAQPFYEKYDAEYDASENCLKAGKRATKGIGRTQPKRWKDAGDALDHPELKGCHMPDGPCGQDDATGGKGYLQYNEYIVYNPAQIRLRYLLMVRM